MKNDSRREELTKKQAENAKDDLLLQKMPEFEADFKQAVELYVKSQPLLPNENQLAQVLEQMQETAEADCINLNVVDMA